VVNNLLISFSVFDLLFTDLFTSVALMRRILRNAKTLNCFREGQMPP
jgi:hypothetical protein